MNKEQPQPPNDLPQAELKRAFGISAWWIAPVLAAGLAGWLIYSHFAKRGPTITILFNDAADLKKKDCFLKYRGAPVGVVDAIELSPDLKGVLVKVDLTADAAGLAREGSQFWIVQPEIKAGSLSGLGTIMSGDYIDMKPGKGEPTNFFTALPQAPPKRFQQEGRKIILISDKKGSLEAGSSIFYRGVKVGFVKSYALADNARTVNFEAIIERPYVSLVHSASKFWNVSGIKLDLSLIGGLDVKMNSLESLIAGGIAFATPLTPNGAAVEEGTIFRVYDKPEDDWLKWSPEIKIRSERQPEAEAQPPSRTVRVNH